MPMSNALKTAALQWAQRACVRAPLSASQTPFHSQAHTLCPHTRTSSGTHARATMTTTTPVARMHAQFAVVVYDHATGTFLEDRTCDIQGAHVSLGYGRFLSRALSRALCLAFAAFNLSRFHSLPLSPDLVLSLARAIAFSPRSLRHGLCIRHL